MNRLRQLLALTLAALPGLVIGCSEPPGNRAGSGGASAGVKRLDGAGSSFVDPLMQEWSTAYAKEKGVRVNYQSKGSGAGIDMMTEKKVDFGATEAPMTDNQLQKAKDVNGEVIHVPLVMGGVVPAYNLPDAPDVKFTGKVLADIYLGKVTKWNDPALKELNPDAKLPDREIAVVRRSDSSGTTFIWTDFLAKSSKDWNKGVSTAIEWPTGVGQKGTDGVAGHVKRTPGALGYVELIYALKNNIPFGAVQNSAGKFVKADLKSVTAAASAALEKIPDDLRYTLTNAPGEDAYPVAGTTWAVLYTRQPPEKAKPLVEFLRWVTHEGQDRAEALHYAKLPEGLVKRVDRKLDEVTGAK